MGAKFNTKGLIIVTRGVIIVWMLRYLFNGGFVMEKFDVSPFENYIIFIRNIAKRTRKKIALKHCNACEKMGVGYEMMAQINLEFSETGFIDYLSALSVFELNLIGEDNKSEY